MNSYIATRLLVEALYEYYFGDPGAAKMCLALACAAATRLPARVTEIPS